MIVLTAYKYVYYFIAYPVHDSLDDKDMPLRHYDASKKPERVDTLEEMERDTAPFSVHEPASIWALSTAASTSSKYESLQEEFRRIEDSSDVWTCNSRSASSSCVFNEGSHTSGGVGQRYRRYHPERRDPHRPRCSQEIRTARCHHEKLRTCLAACR